MHLDACEFLSSGIENIQGVGKVTAKLLRAASYNTAADILFCVPYRYINRAIISANTEIHDGMSIIANVTIMEHRKSGKALRIITSCHNTIFELAFFNNNHKIPHMFPIGGKRTICGTITKYGYNWQIAHPELSSDPPMHEPVYHTISGINGKLLNRLAMQILAAVQAIPEWNDFAKDYGWPGFKESLRILHNPQSADEIAMIDSCRARLACDEILGRHIAMNQIRMTKNHAQGRSTVGTGLITALVRKRLGFTPTQDQESAIHTIAMDQAAPHRMFRILLGDVGSGKTLVALFAMLNAVENGRQAALLVPTEMLAYQHYNKISTLLEGTNISIELMAGKTKGRKALEARIKSGEVQILIGAHALFQESIHYADLGLAVIDEQHRFGVEHRQFMANKGEHADILFMSATPIPRSMIMLRYGYLDCSVLTEKPSIRGKITTVVMPNSRVGEIILRISEAQRTKPMKVYWVCPLIDESENLDLTSVNERWTQLSKLFPGRVGIVHRRVPMEEREKTIADFVAGNISILIATTVVEVGIDVADASAMIIENAHRFGLSQLHQLRGRVARGIEEGSCILLHDDDADQNTLKRLHVLRNNDDGFKIAEHDLKIRGGGDLVGYRQSGRWNYKFFAMDKHEWILQEIPKHPINERTDVLLRLFQHSSEEGVG